MNRNIKFRGKCKNTGKWVYGYLSDETETLLGKKYTRKVIFEDLKSFQTDNFAYVVRDLEVIPETVGQFTGLYDKNKEEIYEDDILCLNHNGSNYLVVVGWNNEVGAWCIRFDTERIVGVKPLGEWLCDYSMEVIGSIHDNLGLLK